MNEEEIIEKAKDVLLLHCDGEYNPKDIDFIKWIIKEARRDLLFELIGRSKEETIYMIDEKLKESNN